MLPKDVNENATNTIEKPELGGDSTPTSQADSNQRPRPKNSKLYYVMISIYCLFLLINGTIIALAPLSWMESPMLGPALKYIARKMPGMIHLAGISPNPAEVIFGYTFAMLSAPIHFIMHVVVALIRYKIGFVTHEMVMKAVKWTWSLPLFMWVAFGTCLFCQQEPGWRAYVLIETGVHVAVFAQFVAMLPGVYLAWLILFCIEKDGKTTLRV